MSAFNPRARRRARELVVQALYQWELTHTEVIEIENQFIEHADMSQADKSYFQGLLYDIVAQHADIDALYQPFCDRDPSELTPVERSVLRLACYELHARLDIPYKVIINEALELNKLFGNESGFKYVNAVLDKTAAKLRADEIK